ncbi:vWA domain-containing protein [Halobacteriovorax marinus]|uniref:vWA domain-containing protein n=1 Tax=Halobacteriovorax marinus TaxID=97084 RepID=UPI003A93E51B
MSFEYHQYLIFMIPALIIYFYIYRKNDLKFYRWVEDHWFFKQTFSNKVSRVLLFVAMATLVVSMLDLRGPEEKIDTSIPDQKTIILIDKSASMLVEDVRPNRFKKAVMMARHFVKRAAGHQISIIVFSDTHKRVVPFTDDIDLLDSILGGLLELDINVGGSELSMAMKEATNYFALDNEYKGGNLLVFTDGEEHDSLENFNLNEDVNLAVVGVGTLNGGAIPLRRKGGSFLGYKKFNGKEINSKLNEVNIKRFVNRTKNSKYWISLSYSLPTDEVLDFFRAKFQAKLSKGQSRIRPVLAKWLVIPAVIIYFVSYLFSLRRSFTPLALIIFFIAYGPNLTMAEEKVNPADIKAAQLLNQMKDGTLDEKAKLKVAEELLRLNKAKESSTIYQETLKNIDNYSNETVLNMGTSLLKSGQVGEALSLFDKLKEKNRLNEQEQRIVENNTLRAIVQQKQKKQQEQQKKKEEENKKQDNKDKKKENKDKNESSGDSDQKKNSKDGKSKENQKQNKKKDDSDKDNEDKKDEKDKKNKDEQDNKNNEQKPKNVKDKEQEIKKKRKMVKVPATLKQLMNDDRGLQKKFLKTNIGKDERTEKRDW